MDDASSTSGGDSFLLDWDNNGNCKIGVADGSSLVYNWDGKLREATYMVRLIALGSICCVGLAIVCGIPYSLLLQSDIYPDELLNTIIYLFRAGFVLGVVAVIAILLRRTYWLGLVPAILSILISGMVIYIDYQITMHSRRRAEILKDEVGYYNLRLLGQALIEYSEANSGYLPSAESWCDSLLKGNSELTRDNFKHPKADELGFTGVCQFAFNKNLSEAKLSEIPDDVVFVFEADGDWNLNGTGELLKTRYSKHGYVALFFVNGNMRDYWFYKQAVRTFDKHGKHMYYIKPRWEP